MSSVDDAAEARQCAVERAAEALEAELGALVLGGTVVASLGFPTGRVPEEELARVATEMPEETELAGFGCCELSVARVAGGALILGRACGEGFTREDVHLLRGMARVLDLLRRLEDRRNLLEQLAAVQDAISSRAPLPEVLDAIVAGAARLMGVQMAALRLADADDRLRMSTAASWGYTPTLLRSIKGSHPSLGITRRALDEGRVVVENDYAAARGALPELVTAGVRAALAVPVHEHGMVAGVLVTHSMDPHRRFEEVDQEALTAYAEHASLALAAARTGNSLRQALNDPLTGLANRVLFLDRLDHALARAARSGSTVGVLFVDLDRFKLVNDSLGHSAGDQLLVAAAERISACLRRADTAARLGGDEFALLLEDAADVADTAHAAERVIEALRAPFKIHEREIFVSASVGIALGTVEEPETVLRNADVAMYRAKSRGKDRYELFAPEMQAEVVHRLTLEADLRHAVERDELELHFQPVWRLDGTGAVGVEALVRWRHPERGLLPPGAFIPLAEESGLILQVGR
ncbi:MAG TPA: diguanylate cyclase, partial [Thermoleophilaceae bacterium]|nr:diguanylate cyclase [Thermoleophilaceae bacterium]